MQLNPLRLSRRSPLGHAVLLLAVTCLLGACDRHSAQDLPESYGHGSGHDKSYHRHEPDSRQGSSHFSDSKGLSPEKAPAQTAPEPTATPGGTVAGQLFPSGQ